MRNGYIIDSLTGVVNCEIFKVGGRVIEIYERLIYRKTLRYDHLKKI